MAATLVNARLFRSSQGAIGKYLQSGIISILAVTITFAMFPRMVNLIELIKLKYANENQKEANESEVTAMGSNRRGLISSTAWKFHALINRQGVDITTASNSNIDSKTYFRADGELSRVYSDGSILTGRWGFPEDEKLIIVTINNADYSAEIEKLTADNLKIWSDGILTVYVSD